MSKESKPAPKVPDVVPSAKVGVREAALKKEPNPVRRFLRILGPGLIVGASDDDPSGIGTYAVAGASLGYSTLWMAIVTLPMMSAVQFICARIGLHTGKGISTLLREHYGPFVVYPLVMGLVIANTVNAGADIGAIAAALNLLMPIPAALFIIPIGALILAFQIWGSYRLSANVFKWLTLALFAYVASAFLARPDWWQVLRGSLVPSIVLDAGHVTTMVAILGTTISPYMFFWQAIQEVEEDVDAGRRFLWQRKGTTDAELRYAALDVNVGMLFSNLVMYFIILATAATLFKTGHTHIGSAADAARALEPLAGKAAEILLAIGLIGAGFLAVPILTGSSAYAMASVFGWKSGLSTQFGRAPQFYGVIGLSTLVGILLNFTHVSAFTALYWTAVINGCIAPFLLAAIMLVANNKKIMGPRVNGLWGNILGWTTTAALGAALIAMLALWGR
ncbi:MAG TPA: divalent metal cation transporter [Candidatus Tumulicola sp.]|nr:divalent metal cation transporter [Candidatus Tumulicola sp.]